MKIEEIFASSFTRSLLVLFLSTFNYFYFDLYPCLSLLVCLFTGKSQYSKSYEWIFMKCKEWVDFLDMSARRQTDRVDRRDERVCLCLSVCLPASISQKPQSEVHYTKDDVACGCSSIFL